MNQAQDILILQLLLNMNIEEISSPMSLNQYMIELDFRPISVRKSPIFLLDLTSTL